jgi:methylated-DNA-protein-cysteine methyltransferase-like protein
VATVLVDGVYRLIRLIPPGRVATYGQVAALLGSPRAARAVGRAMRGCPDGIPWHRVVNASGGVSLRANVAGMLTQRMRLQREGIRLRRGRVPLGEYRWVGRTERASRAGPTDRDVTRRRSSRRPDASPASARAR